MIVYYHDDLDGRCAAAIVIQKKGIPALFRQIPITDHRVFPIENIQPGEEVYILDYTPEPAALRTVLAQTNAVTWIDHHDRAIKKIGDIEPLIEGKREVGRSAALLTWEYFNPGIPVPRAVSLINDFDLWRFAFGDETREFVLGLESIENYPTHTDWQDLLDPVFIPTVIERRGSSILAYQRRKNVQLLKDCAYETYLKMGDKEYLALCCDAPNSGGDLFDHAPDRGKYDIFIRFGYEKNRYRVHLTTDRYDVDVSEIAEQFGGGGHRSAAGFRSENLPFERK